MTFPTSENNTGFESLNCTLTLHSCLSFLLCYSKVSIPHYKMENNPHINGLC